jgi:hypothetical protein
LLIGSGVIRGRSTPGILSAADFASFWRFALSRWPQASGVFQDEYAAISVMLVADGEQAKGFGGEMLRMQLLPTADRAIASRPFVNPTVNLVSPVVSCPPHSPFAVPLPGTSRYFT